MENKQCASSLENSSLIHLCLLVGWNVHLFIACRMKVWSDPERRGRHKACTLSYWPLSHTGYLPHVGLCGQGTSGIHTKPRLENRLKLAKGYCIKMCDYILRMHSGAWFLCKLPSMGVEPVCALWDLPVVSKTSPPLTLPTSALCLLDS